MSKTSPFLQEIVENMLDSGASENEIGEVVDTLKTDKEAEKEACNSQDGYFYNEETGVCEVETKIEPVTTTSVDVKDDPIVDTSVETDSEVIVDDAGNETEVTEKSLTSNVAKETLSLWSKDTFKNFTIKGDNGPINIFENQNFLNNLDVAYKFAPDGLKPTVEDVQIYLTYLNIRDKYDRDNPEFRKIAAGLFFKDDKNARVHGKGSKEFTKEYTDWFDKGIFPKNIDEATLQAAENQEIHRLEKLYQRDVYYELGDDVWNKVFYGATDMPYGLHLLNSSSLDISKVMLGELEVKREQFDLPDYWVEKLKNDPSLYNSSGYLKVKDLAKFQHFNNKLPDNFQEQITETFGSIGEEELQDVLIKSFPNAFGANFEDGEFINKNGWRIEQLETNYDKLRLYHPDGWYLDLDLESITDVGNKANTEYEIEQRVGALREMIVNFMSGPGKDALQQSSGWASDAWDNIDVKHPTEGNWSSVKIQLARNATIDNLRNAFPEKPEILLMDNVAPDGTATQLSPYKYPMGNTFSKRINNFTTSVGIKWYRETENGFKSVIKTQKLPIILGNESFESQNNRKVNSFLTYRYYHTLNKTTNNVHLAIYNPILDKEFDYNTTENQIFMSDDADFVVDFLNSTYGDLNYTFDVKNVKDKYGLSSGRKVIKVYSKSTKKSIEIPTALNYMIGEDMITPQVTDTESLAFIIGKARHDLINFIDQNTDREIIDTLDDRQEKLWNMAFGPEGFLVFSEEQEDTLDRELDDIASSMENQVREIVAPAGGVSFTAYEDAEYAENINAAVQIIKQGGGELTQEKVIDLAVKMIRANKESKLREKMFAEWYNTDEAGEVRVRFFSGSNSKKEEIQNQINYVGRSKINKIKSEILKQQDLIKGTFSTFMETNAAKEYELYLETLKKDVPYYKNTDDYWKTVDYITLTTNDANYGKRIPKSIYEKFLVNQKIVSKEFDKIKKLQEKLDDKIFKVGDLEATLDILNKSYNWSDRTLSALSNSLYSAYLSYVGNMNFGSSEVRTAVANQMRISQEDLNKYSSEQKITTGDINLFSSPLATIQHLGMGFLSVGADQAGTLLSLAIGGGNAALTAIIVGGQSGGREYYMNAGQYFSENGTLNGFDEDGKYTRQAWGVGAVNGLFSYTQVRFLNNVGTLLKNNPGYRTVHNTNLKTYFKQSLNLKTGVVGSGGVDIVAEVATEVAEGVVTGDYLTTSQLVDVAFDTGLFNFGLGFIPGIRGAYYSMATDFKRTDAIRDNFRQMDDLAPWILQYEALVKEGGIELAKKKGYEKSVYDAKVESYKELQQKNDVIIKETFDAATKFDKDAWNGIVSITKEQEKLRNQYTDIQNSNLSESEKIKELNKISDKFNNLEKVRTMMVDSPGNLSRWGALLTKTDQISIDKKNEYLKKAEEKYKQENNDNVPDESTLTKLAAEEYHADLIREDFNNTPKRTKLSKNSKLIETVDEAIVYVTQLYENKIQELDPTNKQGIKDLKDDLNKTIEGIKNGAHGLNVRFEGEAKSSITIVENAAKDGKVENRTHESGHDAFIELLGTDPAAYKDLSDVVQNYLKETNPDLYAQLITGVEKRDDGSLVEDEVVMRFLEYAADGKFDLKDNNAKGIASLLTFFSTRAIQKNDNSNFSYRLDGEAGAINFLIGLGKKIKDGTYTRADFNEIKQNQFIQNKKDKIKEDVNTSKSKFSVKEANKVNSVWNEKGKDGAFDIAELYGGMINNIVNKYSTVPGFHENKEDLIAEIKYGKRGLIDLINEYNPESGVPLSAWINKYLKSRSIEAAERIMSFDAVKVEYDPNADYRPDSNDNATSSVEVTAETGVLRKILNIEENGELYNKTINLVKETLPDLTTDEALKNPKNQKKYRQALEKQFVASLRTDLNAIFENKDDFVKFLETHQDAITKLVAIKYKNRFKELSEEGGRMTSEQMRDPDALVTGDPGAGNTIWNIKDLSKEEFVKIFTEGRTGNTRKNSLLNALANELALDAVFTALPPSLDGKIAKMAEAIKRDPNVKFSAGNVKFSFGDTKYMLENGEVDVAAWEKDVRAVYMASVTDENFMEKLDLETMTVVGLDMDPIVVGFVYDKLYDPHDNAVSQRFKSSVKNNPNFKGNAAADKFNNSVKEGGSFKNNEKAQQEQHNANVIVVGEFLPADVWRAINGRGFGYLNRGMDEAASKLNEKGPRKDGKKMPTSNQSYRGATPLQVKGWEFDYENNVFVGTVNGERVTSNDPVGDPNINAELIRGKYYNGYNSINDNLNEDVSSTVDINYDNVRVINKDVSGGIMQRIDAIRYGSEAEYGAWGSPERRNNIIEAVKELLPEIIAANKANVDLSVIINESWHDALLSGKVNGAQYIQFLQVQCNDTMGPKGLSTLTGFEIPQEPRRLIKDKKGRMPGEDGYVETFEKTQGEHLIVNAETQAKAADLMARAFNFDENGYVTGYKEGFNKENVREELYKIYNGNTQLQLDSRTTAEMDAGPGKQTSSAGMSRVNFIKSDVDIVTIDGRSYDEFRLDYAITEQVDAITREYNVKNERDKKQQVAIENIIDKGNNIAEVQGASVFDFDETVGISDNFVIATRYNEKTGLTEEVKISSADWPTMGEQMVNAGWTMDFSDFNKVTDGKPGPFMPKLKERAKDFGTETSISEITAEAPNLKGLLEEGKEYTKVSPSTFILTARAKESAPAIQAYLLSEGIYIPLDQIVGLGDSTGQAKADWIEENLIWTGFNDIFFVDDAFSNVDAVDKMFNKYPPGLIADGGRSVLVRPEHRETHVKFSGKTNSETMNIFIEQTSGVDRNKRYSGAQAKLRNIGKGLFRFNNVIPYSAEDFKGLLYQFLGKGDIGEYQMAWFKEKLIDPYSRGEIKVNEKKVEITEKYNKLKKDLPKIGKSLRERIQRPDGTETMYTIDHAVRVYLWDKNGIEIPGISKRDRELLVNQVASSQELITFANQLGALTGMKDGYVNAGKYWTVENIASDITQAINESGRTEAMAEFVKNKNEIFSEENLNKIEAVHGSKFREALENMLDRMETGRSQGKTFAKVDRVTDMYNKWTNNSVGAIMFLNGRSAILQTISSFNYIKMTGPNNIINATKAFANQPQFWKDFAMLWNSKYLVSRRKGQQRGINEAELMAAVEKADNKAKAAVAWLLEKGFLPTQIADSFAIASGGASYVRNYGDAIYEMLYDYKESIDYETAMSTPEGLDVLVSEAQYKDLVTSTELNRILGGRNLADLTKEEIRKIADQIAMEKFVLETETGQQSSRQDMLSQQQTGGLGRLILAFKNTPMQYTRKILRATQDLKNNRGNPAEHIGQIAYYGVVQNLMFTGLQQALYAKLGEEDEEWDKSTDKVINSMVDSILNGMGLSGTVVATVKNGVLEFQEQDKRGWNADHTYTVLEFANFSPTIGSKLRKIYSSIKGQQLNEGAIAEMDLWDPQNPAWSSVANLVSALTNVPLDRAVNKINNLLAISADENEWWQNLSLALGWNTWDVGVETKAKKINVEVKEKKKEEKKQKKLDNAQDKVDVVVKEEVKKEKEGEGKDVNTCAAVKSNGQRCTVPVDKAGDKCQYHASDEEKAKMKKCSFIKKNGKRCGNFAVTDAGTCNVPQHQPGYKK